MKSTIFWDITPSRLLSVKRRFGETYHLHLQDRRNNKLSKIPAWKNVPPKRRLTLNGLYGVISQKMILIITTAVRTSNPAYLVYVPLLDRGGKGTKGRPFLCEFLDENEKQILPPTCVYFTQPLHKTCKMTNGK
jgi:hypothetical protein